jgi:hypothetical protein
MTTTALNNTAQQYRKPLLLVLLHGLSKSLLHMNLKTKIQWKEIIGQLLANYELAPINVSNPNQQNSGITSKKRELEVYLGQVLAYESPQDLAKSIYGSALVGSTKPVTKHPLEAQILTLIVNNTSHKVHRHLFDAVRDDNGTTTKDLFDGFDTITAAEISATNISSAKNNYINLGTIDDTNAVDQLMTLWNNSEDEVRESQTKLFIPWDVMTMYNKDYAATIGANPYNLQYEKTYLEGTNRSCELVPLVGKKASKYLHLTKSVNMNVGVDDPSDMDFIKAREVENPNVLQFVLNAKFGTQFESIEPQDLMVGEITPIS